MSLLDTASLIVTPNGTKAGTLYSVIPNTTLGDMDVVRATDASYRGSNGLIQYASPNVPRLDYSNGTCPSILVEPQRTNLLTYSQQFDNADWINENVNLTPNSIISPSGILNGYKMTDTSVVAGEFRIQQNKTTTLSTPYTATVFLKAGDSNFAMLRMYGGNLGLYYCVVVDLSNGTITKTQNGGLTSSLSYTITSCVNGWYKLTATSTMVSTNLFHIVHVSNSGTPSIGDYGQINYTGTGSNSIYVWGAQLEAGSYATSYIPTTSASVTRNADVINKTGISSLIGQTEGTLFFDGILNNCEKSYANILNGERNNNASFFITYVKSTNSLQASMLSNGFASATIQAGYFLPGQRVKIAYSYKSGSSVLYLNGIQVGTSAQTFTLPSTIDDLYINDSVTYSGYQESISNYVTALWKTKLTAVQLAQLTTI